MPRYTWLINSVYPELVIAMRDIHEGNSADIPYELIKRLGFHGLVSRKGGDYVVCDMGYDMMRERWPLMPTRKR